MTLEEANKYTNLINSLCKARKKAVAAKTRKLGTGYAVEVYKRTVEQSSLSMDIDFETGQKAVIQAFYRGLQYFVLAADLPDFNSHISTKKTLTINPDA